METINICAWCQKEFPEVNAAVTDAWKNKKFDFSHGICKRHYAASAKELGKPDEFIQTRLKEMGDKVLPDLKEHPELVKQYSQGIFTPEQFKQNQFPETLRETFLRRAGLLRS